MHDKPKERYIISLGGSLIVPPSGIDTAFLLAFRQLILRQLELHPQRQFFLITGGGQTNRLYNAAAKAVAENPSPEDLDWIGIKTNCLNAQLVRTIFADVARPEVITDFSRVHQADEPVVVVGSWKPGRSSDYVAVKMAEDYQAGTVINLSNIAQVYDKDPKEFPDAKPLSELRWADYCAMVGDVWVPRMSTPFDPIAAKRAQELRLTAVVMDGTQIDNLEGYLENRPFTGTVIDSDLAHSAPQTVR